MTNQFSWGKIRQRFRFIPNDLLNALMEYPDPWIAEVLGASVAGIRRLRLTSGFDKVKAPGRWHGELRQQFIRLFEAKVSSWMDAMRLDPGLAWKTKYVSIDVNGCWIWSGAMQENGYGMVWHGNQRTTAHRFFYEIYKGRIPENLVIDHKCRNRRCVNPDHLEPVTSKENVLRGVGVTADNAKATHCKHGHVFDIANTGYSKNGRFCRECRRNKDRQRRRASHVNS